MYFEFSYGNTRQYDFLCIFKTLGRMQHKKIFLFFTCGFILKKKLRFKRNFPKRGKILKRKKKIFLCFFIIICIYFSFIFFFGLGQPEWVDSVEADPIKST
jgi:amino acid transporter